MTLRMHAAAATLALAACLGAAQASTVAAIGSYNSFGYSTSGATAPNNIIESDFFNNVFRFDLAGLTGTVTGATLSIIATGSYQTPSTISDVLYSVYDVTTDLDAVSGSAGRAAAAADFGSGTLYGSTIIATPGTSGAMPAVTIDLAGAIADLNRGLGGLFDIGGTSNLPAGNQFLWLSSNAGEPVATLALTFAPDVAPIPLPAGLPLLLAGLGGLALLRRRAA